MNNWRPKDWVNPLDGVAFEKSKYDTYEAGADAILEAVIKWLDEPCSNKTHIYWTYKRGWKPVNHRYLCPECLGELKGKK